MRSHSHVPTDYTSQQPARSCTIGPLGRKPEVLEVQQTNDPVSKTCGVTGLPFEDLCVDAATTMSRLSAPASPECARCKAKIRLE